MQKFHMNIINHQDSCWPKIGIFLSLDLIFLLFLIRLQWVERKGFDKDWVLKIE